MGTSTVVCIYVVVFSVLQLEILSNKADVDAGQRKYTSGAHQWSNLTVVSTGQLDICLRRIYGRTLNLSTTSSTRLCSLDMSALS
jgi:hypothetical protein